MKTKLTQKKLFQLDSQERHDLLEKILVMARSSLMDRKMVGIKFKDIAHDLNIPKQRISEIYTRRYINEQEIALLVAHGYLRKKALLGLDLTHDQRETLRSIFPEPERQSSATAS